MGEAAKGVERQGRARVGSEKICNVKRAEEDGGVAAERFPAAVGWLHPGSILATHLPRISTPLNEAYRACTDANRRVILAPDHFSS